MCAWLWLSIYHGKTTPYQTNIMQCLCYGPCGIYELRQWLEQVVRFNTKIITILYILYMEIEWVSREFSLFYYICLCHTLTLLIHTYWIHFAQHCQYIGLFTLNKWFYMVSMVSLTRHPMAKKIIISFSLFTIVMDRSLFTNFGLKSEIQIINEKCEHKEHWINPRLR